MSRNEIRPSELKSLVRRMEASRSPSPSEIASLHEAELTEVLRDDCDPLSFIERLAALGARLWDEGHSGADEVWDVFDAACMALPGLRPEHAEEALRCAEENEAPEASVTGPALAVVYRDIIATMVDEFADRYGEDSRPVVVLKELEGDDATRFHASRCTAVEIGDGRWLLAGRRPAVAMLFSEVEYRETFKKKDYDLDRFIAISCDAAVRVVTIEANGTGMGLICRRESLH